MANQNAGSASARATTRQPNEVSARKDNKSLTGRFLFYEMRRRKKAIDTLRHEKPLCSLMNKGRRTLSLAAALVLVAGAASAGQPPQPGWDLALTGGFVASGLVDPVYALGNVTGQPTRVVVRERDQESTVSVNVAMFGEVYHGRWPWLAPIAVGIGIRGDSRATVFMGSALRFGPHASFAGGLAIGPVNALPAGTIEGRPVTDSNALSNLVTRTTQSWFVGMTYTFTSLR
jgi:hypothetical protein